MLKVRRGTVPTITHGTRRVCGRASSGSTVPPPRVVYPGSRLLDRQSLTYGSTEQPYSFPSLAIALSMDLLMGLCSKSGVSGEQTPIAVIASPRWHS